MNTSLARSLALKILVALFLLSAIFSCNSTRKLFNKNPCEVDFETLTISGQDYPSYKSGSEPSPAHSWSYTERFDKVIGFLLNREIMRFYHPDNSKFNDTLEIKQINCQYPSEAMQVLGEHLARKYNVISYDSTISVPKYSLKIVDSLKYEGLTENFDYQEVCKERGLYPTPNLDKNASFNSYTYNYDEMGTEHTYKIAKNWDPTWLGMGIRNQIFDSSEKILPLFINGQTPAYRINYVLETTYLRNNGLESYQKYLLDNFGYELKRLQDESVTYRVYRQIE